MELTIGSTVIIRGGCLAEQGCVAILLVIHCPILVFLHCLREASHHLNVGVVEVDVVVSQPVK